MSSITVIVNIWKRNSLSEIVSLIKNQTVFNQINEIIVWQNEDHVDIKSVVKDNNLIHIQSNKNWKFHARFTLPLLVDTDYCIILDDDTLPMPKYLEECIRVSKENDDKVIICSNGRDIVCINDPTKNIGYEALK
jgi:hypothetical protein